MATNADAPPAAAHMNWGDEIRKIPKPGLSQRRLAKLADVDRASLLRLEKVRQQPGTIHGAPNYRAACKQTPAIRPV